MKKTHKKIAGFLGLLTVAAVTAVAIMLPAPATQATTSVTDTIQVRVVTEAPDVNILNISDGEVVVLPEKTFDVYYNNVGTATLELVYTDLNGVVSEPYPLDNFSPDYDETQRTYTVNLSDFGYGKFEIRATGEGVAGPTDIDVKTFYYYPAYAELDKVDNNYYLDVYYDPIDSEEGTGSVSEVAIKIYYPDSDEEVAGISPITVPVNADGTTRIEIPFEEYGLESGEYRVEVYAYGQDGQLLSLPYTFTVSYRANEIPAPDTGAVFQNTNISKTDYLITGLLIFGLVAVAGVMFIMRGDKKKATRKNTRSNVRNNTRRRK